MNRNVSLDILKLIMSLMVVCLHAVFLRDYSELASYLTTEGLFRIAVPVFLIINGYYFYPVVVNHRQFIWLKRVLILYVFWMLVYAYFWLSLSSRSPIGFCKLLMTFLVGYHHLWYVSGMLGAALVLLGMKRFGIRVLTASLLFTFVCGVAIQYAGNYHVFAGSILDRACNSNKVHRNFLFVSYPFFALGYLINQQGLLERISRVAAGLTAIVGLLLLVTESYLNYIHPLRDGEFDNYATVLLAAPAVFAFFMKQEISSQSKSVALYASSIFFIHSLVLSLLKDYAGIDYTPLAFAAIAVSAVLSIFIVKLNERVKFIL